MKPNSQYSTDCAPIYREIPWHPERKKTSLTCEIPEVSSVNWANIYLHLSLDATSTAFGVKKTHDNMAKPVPLTPEKKITDDPMIVADPEPVAGAMDDLDLEGMPDPLHSDRMDHSN
jgi:hypothetical protein